MLEAHFAVPAAGGVLVAINNRLGSSEVEYILGHSGARYLLLDAELAPVVAGLDMGGVTVIECTASGGADDAYEQRLAAASAQIPANQLRDEEETISINYTSGTTGRPKGVQYTYRGAYLNALNEAILAGTQHGLGLPVDAAHVPLQRLVLSVGGDRGGGLPRGAAGDRCRSDLGADRHRRE